MLGHSPQMREVRELIRRVADTDVTVLIRGESGTGKELVARGVHAASPRRGPAVREGQLRGPARRSCSSRSCSASNAGRSPGATQHKPGKFEFANHGTIFLDEIGEMQRVAAGEAAAGAPGRRVRAAGRQPGRARRRARRGRHESRPRASRGRRRSGRISSSGSTWSASRSRRCVSAATRSRS